MDLKEGLLHSRRAEEERRNNKRLEEEKKEMNSPKNQDSGPHRKAHGEKK